MSDDPLKYNTGARFFHWASAALILCLLPAGFAMVAMEYSPLKLQLYGWHKALGLGVLLLVVLRVVWRVSFSTPSSLNSHQAWEKSLSKTIHFVLYIAIVLMPISGWVMSSAGDFPISFFGLLEVPKIVPKDENIFELSRSVHEVLAFVIIGCVGLHVVGALKHHFIDKDVTLTRMSGRPIYGFLALLLLGVALVLWLANQKPKIEIQEVSDSQISSHNADEVSAVSVEQSEWVIDPENSSIAFTFRQYGSPVQGSFDSFAGRIVFDPDDLGASHAEIHIPISSISTGSADRDAQARSAEWFDAAQYPEAVFTSERFEAGGGAGEYAVYGRLKIRDADVPISFPFSLEIRDTEDGTREAMMGGVLSLERLDFGVGQGQWESTEAIENDVEIELSLRAVQSSAR